MSDVNGRDATGLSRRAFLEGTSAALAGAAVATTAGAQTPAPSTPVPSTTIRVPVHGPQHRVDRLRIAEDLSDVRIQQDADAAAESPDVLPSNAPAEVVLRS